MKNQLVAKILFEIADLLEVQGVEWRPQAYRKAAMTIDTMQDDIDAIYLKAGLNGLEEIPGVGKAIAAKIAEILETGRLEYHEQLKKDVPVEFEELTAIQGLGPKSVKKLYSALGIRNLEDLKKAVAEHKIQKLPGFGEKSEEDFARGIKLVESSKGRMLLGRALPEARRLVAKLAKSAHVAQIEVAGSLRRRKETIGDIDILVTSRKPDDVMKEFISLEEVREVVAQGQTKTSVILKSGINSDLRVVESKSFGSALQYFTGSKEHNVKLRKLAISKGMKLSEYGLFKDEKPVAGKTEEEVYKALGLQWIPPEMREDLGEVELAMKGKLPEIVGYKDIRGDFHVHSNWSDGTASLEENVRAAEELGHEFICLSDHIGDITVANPIGEDRFHAYLKAIGAINSKIQVLKGAEVDIRKDGSLAISSQDSRKLDVVIASVHRAFKMTPEEMTERLITAIKSGGMHILGHPTGRLIGIREGFSFDFAKVFEAAADNGVAIELNSLPERLDLNDVNARTALEAGCELAIDTDAHNPMHLGLMEFGVAQARRAWAPKKKIWNALSNREIENRVGW